MTGVTKETLEVVKGECESCVNCFHCAFLDECSEIMDYVQEFGIYKLPHLWDVDDIEMIVLSEV